MAVPSRTTGAGTRERVARTVLAELRLAVVDADAELRIITHTPELAVLTQHPGDSLIGQAVTELFPELAGCEEELLAVARGQSERYHLPLINRQGPGGEDRYFSLTALPHPDLGQGLIVLVQDETAGGRLVQQVVQQRNEVRLLRAELEAANARLLRLDADKSAFLRMAAHDLRAPLTIIRGYVDMVLRNPRCQLSPEAVEGLQVVLARSQGMARLIDDLLDVERIEAGEVRPDLAPVDLGALVAEVGSQFLPLARESSVDLAWHADPDLPRPRAARDWLVQALGNLVSNGIKFTPAGGRVLIEAFRSSQEAIIQVSDTGPGLSEADQARLFQRFFRSDDARQRRIPGTGLGLSIVRALIEQQGGRVFCHSQLGQGSTFGLALPLEEE